MKKRNILNHDEIQMIEDKIRKVEKTTSGEIVVAVSGSSSRYLDCALAASSFTAILLSFALIKLMQNSSTPLIQDTAFSHAPEMMLSSFIFLFFISQVFFSLIPRLRFPFISEGRKDSEIRKRAEQIFFHNRLDRTVNKTGILIFLSLFEKKIYILADEGIISKTGISGIKERATRAAESIRKKKAAEAIIKTIESFEQILAEEFPAGEKNPNELPDKIIFQ